MLDFPSVAFCTFAGFICSMFIAGLTLSVRARRRGKANPDEVTPEMVLWALVGTPFTTAALICTMMFLFPNH